MSEKNTDNNELSMDELKDVAGGGMSLDRLGTHNFKGKKVTKENRSVIDGDLNDRADDICT